MSTKPIILKLSDAGIEIYLHHKKSTVGNYMRYFLEHFEKPYIGPEYKLYQNQDLYRLSALYDYRMTRDGLVPYTDYELINQGEWECAFRIKDTNDFHGGLHGCERYIDIDVSADGKSINVDDNTTIECDEFKFYQNSIIYAQGTYDDIVAVHSKWYTINENGIHLEQRLRWEGEFTLDWAYLTMLPIKRNSENGDIITDTARVDGIIYDVSKSGHKFPNPTSGGMPSDVKKAEIWSDISGLYACVNILKGQLPTNTFFIQNTDMYNKIYFSFAGNGGNYTTKHGEIWNTESHFDIYRTKSY